MKNRAVGLFDKRIKKLRGLLLYLKSHARFIIRELIRLLLYLKSHARFIITNPLIKKQDTLCPKLWDSVFINEYGSVFACCHAQPYCFGSIYQDNLSDIWNKKIRLRIFRWMSLNKCLPCFENCTILSEEVKCNSNIAFPSLPGPRSLSIAFGTFCNLDCIMCRLNLNSQTVLDNEMLKRNIDWDDIEEIIILGGEMLAIKSAREFYLWLVQEKKKKVSMYTNGLLIDDEWAQHLARGCDRLAVSVNAATKRTHELINRGSNFERVIGNIKKIISIREKYNPDLKLLYKFTIVPQNVHEIAPAIEFADNLGCDSILFAYDDSVPLFLEKDKDLKQRIKEDITEVNHNSKMSICVDVDGLVKLGLFKYL